MRYISLYSLYVSMFQCFTETKCMPCAFCGVFMQYMLISIYDDDLQHRYGDTVKPVLSDHIKQDIFLAFQTGGCLLLYENRAECSFMLIHYFDSAISSHLNGWSLEMSFIPS